MRINQLVAAGIVSLLAVGQAMAAPCTNPAGIFTCSYGSGSFPGTYAGTVGTAPGAINQIGDLALYNNGTGGALVTGTPSIYEFYLPSASTLNVQAEVGNNGTGQQVYVALDALGLSMSSTAATLLSTVFIPFSSGPSGFFTVYNASLAAGYYAVDTYTTSSGSGPNYQVNFTVSAPATAVPEPTTLALLITGLFGLVAIRWYRKQA